MSSIKNVILVGAGGNLGPAILEQLIASPLNVTVLSRKESTSTFPSEVKVIKVDYTDASALASALKGQDAVISVLATAAGAVQPKIIDAAIAAGVKRFIPTEFGSDTASADVRAIVPAFEGKKAVVDYLKNREKEISWTALVTGPFFDWGLKVGFLGPNLKEKTAEVIDHGTAPFTATNLATIGKAVVSILQHEAETKNQYVYISSFRTSQAEIVALIEKFTGDKLTVTSVDSNELLAEAAKKIQAGNHFGVFDQIKVSIVSEKRLGDYTTVGLWNDRLGLEKEDIEETVKKVLGNA
ncbi:isoflavone reductase [Mytilinidion resinicola]|uniref:Isoflavone reductase n=1 Tax=Mytilinidion resinicola TaxID=574789 RepID=A0A6A6YRC4_9PEZI|nr:isoflavone reductase [Mytilinidion resinicola]KAF2810515.1 isoflavone reductase [Mytilinidion resinicola]